MASSLWNKSGDSFRQADGTAYAGAIASFYVGNTTTPLVVYSDYEMTTPLGSTVTADANGLFPAVFLPEGYYGFRVLSSTGSLIFSVINANSMPQPATTSGGTINPDDYVRTGDIIGLFQSGGKDSWVRLNGKTIGNASSGGTERANADTANLFAYLWNNVPDTYAPVSSGRGASAAADYAANKIITLPSARGRPLVGIDDMGAGAANIIQTAKTITLTSGSAVVTMASNVGVAVGQIVIASGVPVNTYVVTVATDGISATLSAVATSTGAVSARFSLFPDAQQVGAFGGSATHRLSSNEGEAHTHIFTGTAVPDHSHGYTGPTGTTTAGAGAGPGYATGATAQTTSAAGGHTPAGTVEQAGAGNDHNNLPPSLLVTWYIKL